MDCGVVKRLWRRLKIRRARPDVQPQPGHPASERVLQGRVNKTRKTSVSCREFTLVLRQALERHDDIRLLQKHRQDTTQHLAALLDIYDGRLARLCTTKSSEARREDDAVRRRAMTEDEKLIRRVFVSARSCSRKLRHRCTFQRRDEQWLRLNWVEAAERCRNSNTCTEFTAPFRQALLAMSNTHADMLDVDDPQRDWSHSVARQDFFSAARVMLMFRRAIIKPENMEEVLLNDKRDRSVRPPMTRPAPPDADALKFYVDARDDLQQSQRALDTLPQRENMLYTAKSKQTDWDEAKWSRWWFKNVAATTRNLQASEDEYVEARDAVMRAGGQPLGLVYERAANDFSEFSSHPDDGWATSSASEHRADPVPREQAIESVHCWMDTIHGHADGDPEQQVSSATMSYGGAVGGSSGLLSDEIFPWESATSSRRVPHSRKKIDERHMFEHDRLLNGCGYVYNNETLML